MISNWEPPSQVLPHLFLGSYSCTSNKDELLKMGIKWVLTIMFDKKGTFIFRYILNLTDSPNLHPDSFIYLQCPVKDSSSQDILPLFEEVFNFINQVRIMMNALAFPGNRPWSFLIICRQCPIQHVLFIVMWESVDLLRLFSHIWCTRKREIFEHLMNYWRAREDTYLLILAFWNNWSLTKILFLAVYQSISIRIVYFHE